ICGTSRNRSKIEKKAASVPELRLNDGASGLINKLRIDTAICVLPDIVGPIKKIEVNNRSIGWITERKALMIA
ncbi:hypothetical protein, partial [Staphylococcus aureus]|uniref:hypothetical protein n=1 Tax=Staphylococcus aureus TaxID=1280 RepID=UPI0021B10ABC